MVNVYRIMKILILIDIKFGEMLEIGEFWVEKGGKNFA